MSLQLCLSRCIEADSQLWVVQMNSSWKHCIPMSQAHHDPLANLSLRPRQVLERRPGWLMCSLPWISSVSVWCLVTQDSDCCWRNLHCLRTMIVMKKKKTTLILMMLMMLQTDIDLVASNQLMRISLVSRGMSISAGPKWWSSCLILSSPGAVPLIADVFGIWFSQALNSVIFSQWFLRLTDCLSFTPSLLSIHSIFLRFNPARLASLFQRKTPPRSVSVPRCARGLGERDMDGKRQMVDLLSCRSLIWQLPTIALKSWIFQRQALMGEHYWANWNFTLMPDRYCNYGNMETMK